MQLIKSIPCGPCRIMASRTDSRDVLVEITESLPGGEILKKIVWTGLSEVKLRDARDYAQASIITRKRQYLVSDAGGVKVTFMTHQKDRNANTIFLVFEREEAVATCRIFLTLSQETVTALLDHLIHALRFQPTASFSQ